MLLEMAGCGGKHDHKLSAGYLKMMIVMATEAVVVMMTAICSLN